MVSYIRIAQLMVYLINYFNEIKKLTAHLGIREEIEMGRIVAIGGGEFSKGETRVLDQYIVDLAKRYVVEKGEKRAPRLLFIPTASEDAAGYIAGIEDYFGGNLGFIVDTLCLITTTYTNEVIREKILSADAIYVGGGDTVRMIEEWKAHQVDQYLKEAYEKGIILSGVSAGSICWFQFGHSDSESFVTEGAWQFIKAEGLGIIPAGHCPHYDEPGRDSFDEMMQQESVVGIALENQTALIEEDGVYQILKANPQKKAYRLQMNGDTLQKQEILSGVTITL